MAASPATSKDKKAKASKAKALAASGRPAKWKRGSQIADLTDKHAEAVYASAMEFIERALTTGITSKKLAAAMGINASTFSALVHKRLGKRSKAVASALE